MSRVTVCDYHRRRTGFGKYRMTSFKRYDHHGALTELHFCDECVADFQAGRRNPLPRFDEWQPETTLGPWVIAYEYREPVCDLSCGTSLAEHEKQGWEYVLAGSGSQRRTRELTGL